jgi:hypothetical protein
VLTPLTFTLWPVIATLFRIDYEADSHCGLASLGARSQRKADGIDRAHRHLREAGRGMAIRVVAMSLINSELKKNDIVEKKHHYRRTLNGTENSQ